jgi:dihydroflavonol-4-reductase
MTLREILLDISRLAGRKAPAVRLPHAVLLPFALVSEGLARLTGGEARATVEGVRMARKRMYYSSDKAVRELGYSWRAPTVAFEDAIAWFREQGFLGPAARA